MSKRKLFIVGFLNEWGNIVELFKGSESECEEFLDKFMKLENWPKWVIDEPVIFPA